MSKLISNLYNAFLWFTGFAKGEKITFMLRRQKQRLGVWWWIISLTTATGVTAFLWWLFIHVLGFA